jgi:hypothetical protein
MERLMRQDFEGNSEHQHTGVRALQQAAAQLVPDQVEGLQQDYDRTANPAYVWEAISHLASRARSLGTEIELPSWVAAYLSRAALEIAWGAGAWAAGDRTLPPSAAAQKVWGANVTSGNAAARGLTAAQRRDMVLEALGFKGSKGWQPLATYQRAKAADAQLRAVKHARAQGKTIREAVPDKRDPHRTLRRTRARHATRTPGAK